MKLALFQELLDLNRGIRTGNARPERLEKVRPFSKEQIRGALAECETARVDTNREFFDNFEAMVEDDASWAYNFIVSTTRKPKARATCISTPRLPKKVQEERSGAARSDPARMGRVRRGAL